VGYTSNQPLGDFLRRWRGWLCSSLAKRETLQELLRALKENDKADIKTKDSGFIIFISCSTNPNFAEISLVDGLEHEWIITFHAVGNVIIPTDELHHFPEG